MAKLGGTKFTWVIKNFYSSKSRTRFSDTYDIGDTGYNCFLAANRKSNKPGGFSLHIFYGPSLPTEQGRCFKSRLTIMNQVSEKLFIFTGMQFFYPLTMQLARESLTFFPEFLDKDSGFLVNDEVNIVVEVDVLEDVLGEMTNKPLMKRVENDGAVSRFFLKEGSSIVESIDVNGFQVFASQVESVKCIFEKHPDIAADFRAKNQHVRNACMSSLLGLIETLCQSLQELSNEDLVEADIALKHVKDAGFRVDWMEKNLEKVKEKKLKELSGLAMLQETEEKVRNLKRKFEELEALAEKQKKDLSATRTSLSFDDVV